MVDFDHRQQQLSSPMFFIKLIILGVVWASLLEYLLHRFIMHYPLLGFNYAFNAHDGKHHHTFKWDSSYHLQDEKDKKTIPMAWWNGIILTFLGTIPPLLVTLYFDLSLWIPIIAYLVLWAYYGTYERIHWCMHLPKQRRLEKLWIFYRLNGHHLLHHRYFRTHNFNVVLPLWDAIFFTLRWRSQMKFAQPVHDRVPDVQPRQRPRKIFSKA